MAITDKQKKLLVLVADGEFHSGEELAEALGLSRSAIWKQLSGLAELGLHYTGVSGRGYRLERRLELLNHAKISAALNDFSRASHVLFEIHDQLDSTNSYLVQKSLHGAASGSACFAEHQTAGKGRRGRDWVSPFGGNIYLSILWRFPHNGLGEIAGLSLAIGVAVIRALKHLQIPDIGLKWPNDVCYQGKKLGGILIEVSGEAAGPCAAVIGVGLNVFLSGSEAEKINQPWTDLSKILGQRKISRNTLAACLLNELIPVLIDFEQSGIKTYLEEWRQYDVLKGNAARLFVGNQVIDGIVQGIDDNGLLLLEHLGGRIQSYASGEVSFNNAAV
ncbi:bifunctional biotin--[acetyl-CoA-carboxylase] ligase/biotin operon repressor BirA [Crenothrix polyspora]|uniref:Bifunctional ligase/repressor BirA n=1 Tax=Crenothrix polyspora TaxID=360316 RepID=A0A1R4HHW7_9GAMM|nr:bifunctional biotin--[acetyl-CoA-carboxylase] ligase/biotin operon repressor BirA [Crenothrix polyspora]SJM95480.1 Bifunctional ligase/repressor BirA [Crenothrix polyspora]